MNKSPLERAIVEAGSAVALAKIAGVTPMAVSYWKARGVPAHQVLVIESATGVSRHELRPDIYPDVLPTLSANLRPNPPIDQSSEDAGILSSASSSSKLDPLEARG
ncbi:transcriptional regulator [Pseudomonas graminis]|uniref:transcriptional regulator n=1 Tax=Pseudomonas graminis TaxID=158627 RepID=UPI0009F5DF94|nr:YdaS family helix-turn-helix protein [Pseudomonas graminis]